MWRARGPQGGASALAPPLAPGWMEWCAAFIPPGVESRCSACTAASGVDGRPREAACWCPDLGPSNPPLSPDSREGCWPPYWLKTLQGGLLATLRCQVRSRDGHEGPVWRH